MNCPGTVSRFVVAIAATVTVLISCGSNAVQPEESAPLTLENATARLDSLKQVATDLSAELEETGNHLKDLKARQADTTAGALDAAIASTDSSFKKLGRQFDQTLFLLDSLTGVVNELTLRDSLR